MARAGMHHVGNLMKTDTLRVDTLRHRTLNLHSAHEGAEQEPLHRRYLCGGATFGGQYSLLSRRGDNIRSDRHLLRLGSAARWQRPILFYF